MLLSTQYARGTLLMTLSVRPRYSTWVSLLQTGTTIKTVSTQLGPYPVWPAKNLAYRKTAKYYMHMCKQLRFLGDFIPQTPYRSLAPGLHWKTSDPTAPLAALSGIKFLCISLWLCFSYDACSAPNSWRTMNRRHGFMAGWHWQKCWSRLAFTV